MAAISSSNRFSVSNTQVSASSHRARGEALETKLRGQGMSEENIKSTLAAMNNGRAKGADGDSSSVSSSSNSSSAVSTDSESTKKLMGSIFESLLKAVGIDESKIKEVMSSLNNGKALGADKKDTSSVSSTGNGYSTEDAFEDSSAA
jgi:hypothetical protein